MFPLKHSLPISVTVYPSSLSGMIRFSAVPEYPVICAVLSDRTLYVKSPDLLSVERTETVGSSGGASGCFSASGASGSAGAAGASSCAVSSSGKTSSWAVCIRNSAASACMGRLHSRIAAEQSSAVRLVKHRFIIVPLFSRFSKTAAFSYIHHIICRNSIQDHFL